MANPKKFLITFRIDDDTYDWLLEKSVGKSVYNTLGEIVEAEFQRLSDEDISKKARKKLYRIINVPVSAGTFKRIIEICDKYDLERSEIIRAVLSYAIQRDRKG